MFEREKKKKKERNHTIMVWRRGGGMSPVAECEEEKGGKNP